MQRIDTEISVARYQNLLSFYIYGSPATEFAASVRIKRGEGFKLERIMLVTKHGLVREYLDSLKYIGEK